jgi:hypothetical protein
VNRLAAFLVAEGEPVREGRHALGTRGDDQAVIGELGSVCEVSDSRGGFDRVEGSTCVFKVEVACNLYPEVTDEEIDELLRTTRPSIGVYAGGAALAVVAPQVAVFGYLLIAIVAVLRARGDERSPPESPAGRSGVMADSRAPQGLDELS